MAFIDDIKARAKAQKKTIVLPEGMDRRTWEAAVSVVKEDFADVIVLATDDMVKENAAGLDINGIKVVNPVTAAELDSYVSKLYELRKAKGMTEEDARKFLTTDFMYYACMMVKENAADGVVSGACHSTANTLRPSLQIIKTKPGTKLVSSFFVMVVPDCELGENGTFVFGDCGLCQNPTSEELAAIGISSAESFKLMTGKEAKVAFLSHSSKGSAKHADIDKVVEAVRIAKEERPDLNLDGELQADAAMVPSIGASKAPGSNVAGQANVLIFPDLDAGNIGYKLVQRLAKAEAYGPATQGIAKPVNDLSRGCSAEDIVGTICVTLLQAQAKK